MGVKGACFTNNGVISPIASVVFEVSKRANMLPGTVKSPDRFVRGYFFQEHVEKTNDLNTGLAIVWRTGLARRLCPNGVLTLCRRQKWLPIC